MSTGRLIGLGGLLRSGKDALADYLVEHHGYVKMGMSDALNEALLALNPWIPVDQPISHPMVPVVLLHPGVHRYQDLHDAVGYVEAKKNPEVRRLLQVLGTEVGREMIHPDVWVNAAEKKIRGHWEAGRPVVITAMRFPNEIAMLDRLGGLSVWVDRDEELRLAGSEAVPTAHASENSVTRDMFRVQIQNNGTLEELHAVARRLAELAAIGVIHAGAISTERLSEGRVGSDLTIHGGEYTGIPTVPPYDR